MPDKRQHRGPHPSDKELFAADQLAPLQTATAELSWLLSRGYSSVASLKLVGDRYELRDRQRTAVMRSACSDDSQKARRERQLSCDQLKDRTVWIDGFNLITSLEAALGGGVLIQGRDGCIRDMASMHGTYRRMDETNDALRLIGQRLQQLQISDAHWLLDRPVSNSGRLAAVIQEMADESSFDWTTELDDNPDKRLVDCDDAVVISADSYIIENCECWYPLMNDIVSGSIESPWLLDLGEQK